MLEGGVHWGYGLLIHLLLSKRKIHAFDAFKGHSEPTEADKKSPDWKPLDSAFMVTLADVNKTLEIGTGMNPDQISERVKFVNGWVQETIPVWAEKQTKIQASLALVHADMDIYEPIKYILDYSFPLLAKGGIIILGRLGNSELMGKDAAVKEFLGSIPEGNVELRSREIRDTNGQNVQLSFIIKK